MLTMPSARSGLSGHVPWGGIIIWPFALGAIPPGWTLCDGTLGTPDMRDFTIVGAGGAYAVGATGGALTHSHNVNQNAHDHNMLSGLDIAGGTDYADVTQTYDPPITCSAENHQSPYKAYAFIMKL